MSGTRPNIAVFVENGKVTSVCSDVGADVFVVDLSSNIPGEFLPKINGRKCTIYRHRQIDRVAVKAVRQAFGSVTREREIREIELSLSDYDETAEYRSDAAHLRNLKEKRGFLWIK